MEFRETGLPVDPEVYRAFTLYADRRPRLSEEGLRLAQLLHKTGNTNGTLLAFALLSGMPKEAWGVIEKRFGPEIIDLKKEVESNGQEGAFRITEISDRARLFLIAVFSHGIAGTLNENPTAENAVVLDPSLHEFILTQISGRTSSPALEAYYEEQIDKLRKGVPEHTPALESGDAKEYSDEYLYPSFENTELADFEQIRAAYDIVTRDPRTTPEDLYFSLDVGEILGTLDDDLSPDAIAAALLQICIRDFDEDDVNFWKETLGETITDVLEEGSVYDEFDPAEIIRASWDFKKIALAHAIAVIDDAWLQGDDELEIAREAKIPLAQLMDVPALQDFYQRTRKIFTPLLGDSGSPALESKFSESLQRLKELVDEVTPKFFPPFKEPPGTGYNP